MAIDVFTYFTNILNVVKNSLKNNETAKIELSV